MTTLDIDDLPKWSPWPARLLGSDDFARVQRDQRKVESEFNQDKFLRALERYTSAPPPPPSSRDLRLWLTDAEPDRERACLRRGRLVKATARMIYDDIFECLRTRMAAPISRSATVIELGCAFGTYLSILREAHPDPVYRGADWSHNACRLADLLYRGAITVEPFDFYADNYPVLENAEGPVTVFTAQAIEQLPDAKRVVATLLRYADKIEAVCHLEPGYELQDGSLMGLMRRRYLELNDYNRNLVGLLKERTEEIEIVELEPNLIGFNPFNALTWIKWRPKRRAQAGLQQR